MAIIACHFPHTIRIRFRVRVRISPVICRCRCPSLPRRLPGWTQGCLTRTAGTCRGRERSDTDPYMYRSACIMRTAVTFVYSLRSCSTKQCPILWIASPIRVRVRIGVAVRVEAGVRPQFPSASRVCRIDAESRHKKCLDTDPYMTAYTELHITWIRSCRI